MGDPSFHEQFAMSIRDFFNLGKHQITVLGEFFLFHLITEGAHGRRSRLLFQRALGSGVTVGVTSVPSSAYDPEHWWKFSAGVREVVGELLAYGYARFLFRP